MYSELRVFCPLRGDSFAGENLNQVDELYSVLESFLELVSGELPFGEFWTCYKKRAQQIHKRVLIQWLKALICTSSHFFAAAVCSAIAMCTERNSCAKISEPELLRFSVSCLEHYCNKRFRRQFCTELKFKESVRTGLQSFPILGEKVRDDFRRTACLKHLKYIVMRTLLTPSARAKCSLKLRSPPNTKYSFTLRYVHWVYVL